MKVVGTRVRSADWNERTLGAVEYTGDMEIPGLLYGKILWSPHAHADIVRIDTRRAEAIPGVLAVVTAADFPPGVTYIHEGGAKRDREPFARGRVRYVGEPVAAVAAESRNAAGAALSAIDVTYRKRPAVLSIDQALRPGAERVHRRDSGTNVSVHTAGSWGDPVAGAAASTRWIGGRYDYPRVTHLCMEPNACIASWDEENQKMEMWVSTQAPYFIVKEVSAALGLNPSQVVLREIAVGGGFGSKSKISEFEVPMAALSRKCGRPVRMTYDRDEEFPNTKTRHRTQIDLRTGFDDAGRIHALEAFIDVDNGAYNHHGPSILGVTVKLFGSMYRPDGVSWTGRLVDTNLQPGGPFRGYGSPQSSLAMEIQIDEISAELGMDPIDIRILNANQPNTKALSGSAIGSARLVECLQAVREAIDWDRKKADPKPGRGIGVACSIHGSGAYVYAGSNRAEATIDVTDEGRGRVHFGGADAGTGQRTILGQIAAEELGIPFDAIEVHSMDSETTPHDMGAWASRGTHITGHATRKAAREMAERLKNLAADKLGVPPDQIELRDASAVSGDDGVPIGDLVALDPEARDGSVSLTSEYVESRMEQFVAGGGPVNTSPSYTFAAHAVEVEVDTATGEVTVVDYVAAHDLGRAINPTLAEGQISGGVVMGLGAALGEELIHEGGRLVNGAMINYAAPRAGDVPTIRTVLVEGPEEAGPYDAKSAGELPVTPVAAAVANAIFDATGARLREAPFTPDKVLAAVNGATMKPRAIITRPSRWWVEFIRRLYPVGLHRVLAPLGTAYGKQVPKRKMRGVATPAGVDEAAMAASRDGSVLVAGDTDLSLQRRQGLSSPEVLVSIASMPALRGLEMTAAGDLRIGAAVRLAELASGKDAVPGSVTATARSIASPQIREAATVGGNLAQAKRCWFFRNGFECYKRAGVLAPCYAVMGDHRFYHAAVGAHRCQAVTPSDLATIFTALDAIVEIAGPGKRREVPIGRFYKGPGEPDLAAGELIVAVRIPAAALTKASAFDKIGLWTGDFAVVSAAVAADVGRDGTWSGVNIVLGAIAPEPLRARRAEATLEGTRPDADAVAAAVRAEMQRIGHPLARNAWKLDAAAGLAARVAGRLDR